MEGRLEVQTGMFSDVDDMRIRLHKLDPRPDLCLCEPLIHIADGTGGGPLSGFSGLSRTLPDLENTPISELLLCWPDACVKVVVDGCCFRWAAFATERALLPMLGQGQSLDPLLELQEDVFSVQWRFDLARFQHQGPNANGPRQIRETPINIREFRKASRIVAWWLIDQKADGKKING